jgi:DNA-binding NtrC family response regulator
MQTILIVDDDSELRSSLATALADEYAVHAVSSGSAAVRFLEETAVDMILLDMLMAEGDGFTVLSHTAGLDPRPRVVILTVVDQVDKAVKAMRLGASDYVVKPCHLDRLRNVLRRALNAVPSPVA